VHVKEAGVIKINWQFDVFSIVCVGVGRHDLDYVFPELDKLFEHVVATR
jgi:hypothetical protein